MCMNLTMQWNDQELLQYLLPWNLNAGNPLEEKHSTEGDWRDQALKCLTKLKKLDVWSTSGGPGGGGGGTVN